MDKQNKKGGMNRKWAAALLYALLLSAFCGANLFSRLDNTIRDALFQHEQTLDGTIYVLGIDERALEELGPLQTWDRSVMASIVEALNQNPEAKPAAIGVDMMYYGETTQEHDERLSGALGKYGNVVVGASVNFKQSVEEQPNGSFLVNDFSIGSVEEPYEALKKVTRQGHLNTLPDEDGMVRKSLHKIETSQNNALNSFAFELYRLYAEKNGLEIASPPLDGLNRWNISYSAKPGGYSDGFSVIDVLNGDLPPEIFADSIVLIGPYATGMRDAYPTPIDHAEPMYGVEIHANIIQALLNGKFPVDVSPLLQSVILFFVLGIAFWVFRRLSPRAGVVLLFLSLCIFFGIAYFLSEKGFLIRTIYLPLGLSVLYGIWLAAHYMSELLERRRVTGMFKKYVAPQVVDELMRHDQQELQLGGAKKDIACLFVDIRGFTPMSEALSPEQVVEVLNEYLALTSSAVFAHEGTLDKFIGDATMAIYNAPLEQEDYIYKAVLTAWDIVQGGTELGRRMEEKFGRSVNFGIGIHCGPAVVGNIGTAFRMDYTAIGDTVNTAARLESNAKPGQVLLSESVFEAVKNRIEAVDLGEIALKGKKKGVLVYGLRSVKEFENHLMELESAYDVSDKIKIARDGKPKNGNNKGDNVHET